MPEPAICGVAARFDQPGPCRRAAAAARARGRQIELYSPAPDDALARALVPAAVRDPTRQWTLGGAVLGGGAGFAMTIWMSRDWPLIVGGKPIISWPPFIDIAFEMTIFWGALFCLAGFLHRARLPCLTLPAAYRPTFANDGFGLFLACADAEVESVREQMRQLGATHTWVVTNPPRGRLEVAA